MKPAVRYYQTDTRWRNNNYSAKGEKKTISSSGCGITVTAMIIASLADKSITPADTAKWSMAHGYKYLNQGTAYGYFVPQLKEYGITCKMLNSSSLYGKSDSGAHKTAKKALEEGKWVIACMGPGNWTRSGHFILLYGYSDGYVYINDPASSLAGRMCNKWSLFASQVKYMWVVDNDVISNKVAKSILKKGSKGYQVEKLQDNLSQLGCVVKITGTFDTATEKELKRFQSRYGLKSDGIYGAKSEEKMKKLIRK